MLGNINKKGALKYAIAGALLGGGYFAVNSLAEEYEVVELDDPKPEAFDVDKSRKVHNIFGRLNRLRKKKGAIVPDLDAAYRQVFLQVDKLLVLEKALLTGADPEFDDGVLGSSYADEARAAMLDFIKLMDKGPRKAAAKQCGDDLFRFLNTHTANVMVIAETAEICVFSDPEDGEDDREALEMLYG